MPRSTILIIDDSAEHRDIVSRLLRAADFTVYEAQPGLEALDIANTQQPDLILLGLSLPGQPGWETARQLRNRAALRHVPILGATVFNALISRARARAIGCVDYVDKPFDLDVLLARIHSLLGPAPTLAA
ncbi:MAG TPA: response regulator [Roseiflexaceae bacterium]|nr:response regulator [Roseiflexaceae bacterium]